MKDFNFEIHSSKIHIDLSGGILPDIADPFVALFKSLIVKKINSIISDKIPGTVKDKVNGIFLQTNGYLPAYFGGMQVDITFPQLPVVSDSTLAMFFNGTLYNPSTGKYYTPAVTAGDIQVLTTSANSVQMALSHYASDSMLVAIYDTGIFAFTIDKDVIPGLADKLTTTYLDGLLPGIADKFGKDQPVSIAMKANDAPRAVFKEADMGLNMDLDLTFSVNGQVAIVVTVTDLNVHVDPLLQNQNFSCQIKTISINQCSATQSVIGDFDSEGFKDFFNISVRIAIPFINELLLSQVITLPDSYMGMVKINAASF